MARYLSDKDISLFEDEFNRAVANGDGGGCVSTSKLGDVLRAVNPKVETPVTEKQLQGVMGPIETINFCDFLKMLEMALERLERANAEIRQMFKFYDQNGDGYVSEGEFREAMKNIGVPISDKEVEDLIKNADKNEDGMMKYEEFAEWYKNF